MDFNETQTGDDCSEKMKRRKQVEKDTQGAGSEKTLTNAKARKIHFTLFSVT